MRRWWSGGNPRPRHKGFKAARPAAIAVGTRPFLIPRPGQGVVAPLARNPAPPTRGRPFTGYAGARAGAQDHRPDDFRVRSGPVHGFGDRPGNWRRSQPVRPGQEPRAMSMSSERPLSQTELAFFTNAGRW